MKLQLFADGQTLFDSTTDEYKATAIDLTEQVNTSNTLEFTLPPFNPSYSLPQNMTSLIELYRNDVLAFEGRVLYSQDDILGNRTFTCEGSLAFLLDSVVRPNTTQNTTILEYFTYLINQHNAQVEEQKQFQVGIVTVTNSTDNVYRIDNDYANTLTVIQEKLVNRLGGYLRVRKVNGVRYIDYLEEYGTTSTQTIEFQKNILDLSQRISSENVITALIPLGAKDETTELPLTIASVNDGKDYIVDETAVSLFGYIYGTNTWDDVTVPANLLTKGQEFLQQNIANSVSIEVDAVDLSMLNVDINVLELGMSVPVISQPHKLNANFVIKKKETQFLKPEDSSITLDTIIKRNTDQVTTNDRNLTEQTQVTIPNLINQVIKNQTSLITGGQGGYVVFGYNDEGQPEELYFMDQPTTATAQNIIRINKNGIGFSNSGFNGPYTNAWTIDGVLNASFITTGKLVGLTIEGNTITGGTISGTTISGTTINGGTINGTSIITDKDLTIGFNLYMGDIEDRATRRYLLFNDEYGLSFQNDVLTIGVDPKNGLSSIAKIWFTKGGAINIDSINQVTIVSDGYGILMQTQDGADMQFNISGDFKANKQLVVSSDERLKDNIKDANLSALIDILSVKEFNYKNDLQKTVGVIAQQFIGTPYEDIILRKGKDGMYAVDYNVILMALVQYVKALKGE